MFFLPTFKHFALWTKGTFGTHATAEYADHVKHDVGPRKIGRLFAGISRRRNGSVLENLRTSGPSTLEDTWRDLYGYAFMTKHVHKCLSKIEISFVWLCDIPVLQRSVMFLSAKGQHDSVLLHFSGGRKVSAMSHLTCLALRHRPNLC